MGELPKKPNLIYGLLVPLLVGGGLTWGIQDLNPEPFEFTLLDERLEIAKPLKNSNSISLVHFRHASSSDAKTVNYPLSFLQRSLENIQKSNPRAIVSLLSPEDFNEGSKTEIQDFIAWAKQTPNLYWALNDLESTNSVHLPEPFESLYFTPFPHTSDNKKFGRDSGSRRAIVQFENRDTLHFKLAKQVNPNLSLENLKGVFSFISSLQVWIRFAPLESFPVLSLNDLYNEVDPRLNNQIVIVGRHAAKSFDELANTVFHKGSSYMRTTELHAHMLETLIQNDAVIRVEGKANFILLLVVSILAVWISLNLSPMRSILAITGLGLFVVFGETVLFYTHNLWFNMAQPLLSIFIGYYFVIPYRLIRESKRRWEIEQKHTLLKQVEELKSNFISMMSHDLKTPLARIKGMLDIIRRDTQPLSMTQLDAMDRISASTQDLLSFIEAILNYAKIASEGVHLRIEPKDINQLVDEVVTKYDFLAHVKHIELEKSCDPLFSINVDPQLLRQVIGNLVENAIKYSPEKTKVTIGTRESPGHVEIFVKDQGPGIPADELPHIFMKFFRSKSSKSSPIKGSGLGLYLAKYFVEMHSGEIFVESAPGQGSIFTVKIPIK